MRLITAKSLDNMRKICYNANGWNAEILLGKDVLHMAEKAAEKKAPAKKTAEKKETAVKKTAAKKAPAAAKVAEKKAPAAAKTAEKKAPAAKKAAKKAETVIKTIVQVEGKDYDISGIAEKLLKQYKSVHKRKVVTEFAVYVKPEENAAYFTINGEGGDEFKVEL